MGSFRKLFGNDEAKKINRDRQRLNYAKWKVSNS
jgi:hypothetical protein